MNWLPIWVRTMFGRQDDQSHPIDPDLVRARQIKRDQENRLLLIEREAEVYRLHLQNQRDHSE